MQLGRGEQAGEKRNMQLLSSFRPSWECNVRKQHNKEGSGLTQVR
jgi:hypothetical protein